MISEFKPASFLRNRAGESASFMSEKLTLEQSGRNRGAVQLYEGPLLTMAAVVNGTRNQFLPRAGFAQKQHRRVGGSHGFHQIQNVAQSRTLSHNSFKVYLATDFIF